jgi:hypothetical protein
VLRSARDPQHEILGVKVHEQTPDLADDGYSVFFSSTQVAHVSLLLPSFLHSNEKAIAVPVDYCRFCLEGGRGIAIRPGQLQASLGPGQGTQATDLC